MTEKIKIALVDDEVLFRKGLELILNQDEALEVTFHANNGKELLNAIKENRFVADVILLDLSMPVMDGVDTLLELQKMANRLKVIILTSHYNNNIISKLIDEGAASFLSKNESPDITIQTIKNVALRGFHYDDYIMRLFRDKMKFGLKNRSFSVKEELSEREIEVLRLICAEYTAKEIADKLSISFRTVEGHRNNMLEKIGAKNIIGLVIYAIERKYYEVKVENF
jgi:DNA-binding NarL/FixJ family response regulator